MTQLISGSQFHSDFNAIPGFNPSGNPRHQELFSQAGNLTLEIDNALYYGQPEAAKKAHEEYYVVLECAKKECAQNG